MIEINYKGKTLYIIEEPYCDEYKERDCYTAHASDDRNNPYLIHWIVEEQKGDQDWNNFIVRSFS